MICKEKARVDALGRKLMANLEIAQLIGELASTAKDGGELVRGMLQAGLQAGLQAEMDAHLGYQKGDREQKQTHGRDVLSQRLIHQDRGFALMGR